MFEKSARTLTLDAASRPFSSEKSGVKAKAAGSKFNHVAIVEPRVGTALTIDDDTIAFNAGKIRDPVCAKFHTVDRRVISVHRAGWNPDIVVLLASNAQHVAQNCEARTAATHNFQKGAPWKLLRSTGNIPTHILL